MTNKKKELEHNIMICEQKLDRAEKLIGGLGGEKDRWTEAALVLGDRYDRVTGDVLLSSGVVAYLGPFTVDFRNVRSILFYALVELSATWFRFLLYRFERLLASSQHF